MRGRQNQPYLGGIFCCSLQILKVVFSFILLVGFVFFIYFSKVQISEYLHFMEL